MKITVDLPEDAIERACGFIRCDGGEKQVVDISIVDAEENELNGLMFYTIHELAEINCEIKSDTPNTYLIKTALRNLLETYSEALDEVEDASNPAVLDSSEVECNLSEPISE
ncbi:hypothetical protein VIN30_01140 [Adlercreutzia sp. R7]|uniref:Uncharacterized protein n=1 Tax=Adlercreutzia wanghongyangiae TaxID=3111451 RepID=A0ABU6IF71_9ACTN|nr:hypothetical protein [Adlercreutzia sp. R7]